MLGDALSFPRRDDDWVKTTLIGGVLTLIGAFVPLIPLLPVQGLLVRVLREGARDGDEMPAFEDWGDLFVDGLKLFVVNLVYVLVPTVLLLVVVFLFAGAAMVGVGAGPGARGGLMAGIGLVGGLLFVVVALLFVVVLYLLPAALTNFAVEDDLGAAFDLGTVTSAAFTGDYFVAVLLAIVVGIVLGIVGTLLSFVVVGVFVIFYTQVVVYYLFARGFGKAQGLGA